MQVRDFMITRVITVKPSTTVKELLDVLTSNRIGGVPVVDNKGNLVGIVSDGDVLRFLAPKPLGVAGLVYIIEDEKVEDVILGKLDTEVKDIMTKRNLAYVTADEEFEKAVRLISRHHFKKLPVVNGAGRVVGVVSRGDIINSLSKKIISSNEPEPCY